MVFDKFDEINTLFLENSIAFWIMFLNPYINSGFLAKIGWLNSLKSPISFPNLLFNEDGSYKIRKVTKTNYLQLSPI